MAGSVDDVDLVLGLILLAARPEARGRSRSNGDTALLLLLHPVHRGGAIVHFPNLVGLAGVKKDALGRGGLTGVDVRSDANVSEQF